MHIADKAEGAELPRLILFRKSEFGGSRRDLASDDGSTRYDCI
jgi:hypothetical protein